MLRRPQDFTVLRASLCPCYAVPMSTAVTVIPRDRADFGGLEGASNTMRETLSWNPSMGSPDQILHGVKAIVDARSQDTAQNDSWAQAAVTSQRDSIVGSRFALNCKPDVKVLGVAPDDPWVDEFQEVVEARFEATSEGRWLDVARRRTLTEMCRLAVSSACLTGEILAPAEWMRENDRPCRTAVHLISPARLSNPQGVADTRYLRAGIHKDFYGRHLGYHIRQGHPGEWYDARQWDWLEVPAQKPWGRSQMLYASEPLLVEQTRGVGDMSAALPHMRMAKKHSQIALQKAVIGATMAAVLESDLPPEELAIAMGALAQQSGVQMTPDGLIEGWERSVASTLGIVQAFMSGSNNIKLDGSQIPALPPGTSMKMLNADNGGGARYAEFEASLNRKTARALNMSYEEFTGDYTNTNYSSGKMAKGLTDRFANARKKFTADRLASWVFTLWLEEELANPESPVPLPPTWASRDDYYRPLMKEAISKSDWIGTGSGQIDELKETQAAMLRLKSGLSTWERECAKLGIDWREMAQQQQREAKLFLDLDLSFTTDASKSTGDAGTQSTLEGQPE